MRVVCPFAAVTQRTAWGRICCTDSHYHSTARSAAKRSLAGVTALQTQCTPAMELVLFGASSSRACARSSGWSGVCGALRLAQAFSILTNSCSCAGSPRRSPRGCRVLRCEFCALSWFRCPSGVRYVRAKQARPVTQILHAICLRVAPPAGARPRHRVEQLLWRTLGLLVDAVAIRQPQLRDCDPFRSWFRQLTACARASNSQTATSRLAPDEVAFMQARTAPSGSAPSPRVTCHRT